MSRFLLVERDVKFTVVSRQKSRDSVLDCGVLGSKLDLFNHV